jgi:NADH-quinone oxidoreductase subunit C
MSQALVELVREKFPDAVISSANEKGDDSVVVKREAVVDVLRFLKNDAAADMKLLSDVVAVDLLTYKSELTGGGSLSSQEVTPYSLSKKPQVEPRFRVSYNLYSVTHKKRLRVVVELRSDDASVPTATGVFRTADWWERYNFDLMGIQFAGHPNLQRILLYPEFVGHPLRKDYPVQKRQPLVKELDFPDLVRGPGPGPGGAGVPMSQTHVGRTNVDPTTYD